MILSKNVGIDEVEKAFQSLKARFVGFSDDNMSESRLSVQDSWKALHLAKKHGWIKLSNEIRPRMDCMDFGLLDIERHMHYAKTANGRIFTLVPDKIVMFPSPADLPDNVEWMDTDDGKHRQFSAGYYAELLRSDFNVSVIACADSGKDYWPAFAEYDLAVEHLPLDGTCPAMLRAMDQLFALTDGARGAVALHSGADAVGGRVGALVAAYLVRRLGFPPDAAIAWIRMVDPALLVACPDGGDGAAGALPELRRCPSAFVGGEGDGGEGGEGGGGGEGGEPGFERAASWPLESPEQAAPDVFCFF